jgi:hypothetical protein
MSHTALRPILADSYAWEHKKGRECPQGGSGYAYFRGARRTGKAIDRDGVLTLRGADCPRTNTAENNKKIPSTESFASWSQRSALPCAPLFHGAASARPLDVRVADEITPAGSQDPP